MSELSFHDLLDAGLLKKAPVRDNYIEQQEPRRILTPRQIARIESVCASEGLVRPKDGERFTESVNRICKQWARVYHSTDKPEIERLTGALKKSSPNIGGIVLEDEQYQYVWSVVNQMSAYNRMFIIRHYIEKKPDMSNNAFCAKIDFSKNTYKMDLADARQEFVVKGGIQ